MATSGLQIPIKAIDQFSGTFRELNGGLQQTSRFTTDANRRIQELEHTLAGLQNKRISGILSQSDLATYEKASAELSRLKAELTTVGTTATSVGSSFGGLRGAIGSVTAAFGAFGIAIGGVAILKGVADLTRLGAQSETVGKSFESLASSAGVASSQMLSSIMTASRGTITELEAMQAANRAMLMGGQQMASALPQLVELARAAAIAQGESMSYMLNSIVTGIARQSPLILDNLGLIVDLEGSNKKYAEQLGTSTEAMTEAQRQQALLNDVLRVAPDYIQRVGADSITSAEQVATLSVAWRELKDSIGEAIVAAGGAKLIGEAADALRGLTADTASTLAQLLGEIERLNPQAASEFMNELARSTGPANDALERQIVIVQQAKEALGKLDPQTEQWQLAYMAYNDAAAALQQMASAAGVSYAEIETGAYKMRLSTDQLAASMEIWLKINKPLATAAAETGEAFSNAVTPTTQWADAIGALSQKTTTATKPAVLLSSRMQIMTGQLGPLTARFLELAAAMDMVGSAATLGLPAFALPNTPIGDVSDLITGKPPDLQAYWNEIKRNQEAAAADSERLADRSAAAWKTALTEMRGMAESALTVRMQPTELDFLKTGLGAYENAPLESVRRLQAIIERGMEEIKVHPDWAAMLKIPPDVLAAGGDTLKVWAMETQQQIQALARPDLIDWDAFIAEFQRQKDLAAGKELTLDIAMGKLKEAGLLTGNKENDKKKIAQMLGLSAPELNLDLVLGTDKVMDNLKADIKKNPQNYTAFGDSLGGLVGGAMGAEVAKKISETLTSTTFEVAVTVTPTKPTPPNRGGQEPLP